MCYFCGMGPFWEQVGEAMWESWFSAGGAGTQY